MSAQLPRRRRRGPNPREQINIRLSELVGRLEMAVIQLERLAKEEDDSAGQEE